MNRRRLTVALRSGWWQVQDSEGPTWPAPGKAEAIRLARAICRDHHACGGEATLIVLRADGRVHYRRAFG